MEQQVTEQQVTEQQAQILRSLLERLQEPEAQDEGGTSSIAEEFAKLRTQSTKYRADKTHTSKTAEKNVNIKKNRYKDIVPFDHSRVKLTLSTSKNDTDYINASFIKGVSGSRTYIATQGPLPNTVVDFLRMIWEYNIRVVVMVCREIEMGKKKCEVYWPKNPDTPFVCEPFAVTFDSLEDKGDYFTRTLKLTYRNSSRTVKQLQYVNWPDHGVPDTIPPILEMLREMRIYHTQEDSPICIHCSAGCGRTGALCVIDYTWNLLKKQMMTLDFNIYDLVQNMRMQRPSLVQTKEQYDLVYRTVKFLLQSFLQNYEEQIQRSRAAVVPSSLVKCPRSSVPSSVLHEEVQTRDLFDKENDESQQNSLASGTLPDPQHVHLQPSHPEDTTGLNDVDVPLAPVTVPVICLTVEDPYFNTPLSSSEEEQHESLQTGTDPRTPGPVSAALVPSIHTDDDEPPPLPQRTPESYILDVDAGPGTNSGSSDLLNCPAGSPPSPVPPLPERTPQSFELACDQGCEVTPASAAKRNPIGSSYEWPAVAASKEDSSSFGRSRSLKSNTSFTADDNPTPPLPNRTPESLFLATENESGRPYSWVSPTVDASSEWDGTPREVLGGVMSRSKCVRARSSMQEPLAAVQPLAPLPVVVAGGGSVDEHVRSRRSSLNTGRAEDSAHLTEKGMSRTKSLKFFKLKPKYHPSPSPPSGQPAAQSQPSGPLMGVLNLGFGNRCAKPKGPRNYPETWV